VTIIATICKKVTIETKSGSTGNGVGDPRNGFVTCTVKNLYGISGEIQNVFGCSKGFR
jgi:hypothetical protein